MNTREKRSGWRNDYRRSMPLTEVVMKDLSFFFNDLFNWLSNGFRLPVLVVYPDFPSKKTTIRKIARKLGFRITNKLIPGAKLVFYFEDVTSGSSADLQKHYAGNKILNSDCTDISKRKVDEVHTRIFNYNTFIDPLVYSGIAVEKSDTNALHDGRVIHCPVQESSPASVYQVLIDNSAPNNMVMDYRVPVMKGKVVLAYKKFKEEQVRFTNDVSYSELCDHRHEFSADELDLIGKFSLAMGAEFCELDILRNKSDQRIYIIDVNKTPYGPPAGLPADHAKSAVQRLTAAFRETFLHEAS